MTEVRGLQLARNDQAAACGLMTQARQDRNPAACAPSGAYVEHFTPATIPASNAAMFRVGRCSAKRCPPQAGVPQHTVSLPRDRRTALTPRL